jgi:N-formylmaleamate deformylase
MKTKPLPLPGLRQALPTAALMLGLASLALAGNPHPDFEVSVRGQGRPVIFIPGLATPGVVWQPAVDQLCGEYQCHVLTLAGFGKTKPSGSDPFLPRVRDELIDYIRDEKLVSPVIVGHSLGGFLALWVAETAPALPGRLVIVDALPYLPGLINPSATPDMMRAQIAPMVAQMADASPEQFAQLEELAINAMVTSPANARRLLAVTKDSDPKTTARAMEELMTADLRPELGKITCPAVVFVSIADKVRASTKEAVMNGFREQYVGLRGVRFVSFDTSKHFIMVDEPVAFLTALRSELRMGPDR